MTRVTLIQIVAHRGASSEAPENTLAAFERAIEVGADMIEFDVRRASDSRLVISHDPVRNPARLPTLEDTLRLTQNRIQLDVELKEPGCEHDAIDLLLRYFPVSDFCITSFLAPALRETRAIHPGIRTGFIFAKWNEDIRAACVSPDIDLLVPQYRLLDDAEQIAKPLFVWTVDDPVLTRSLFERPLVAAIVTNNPRQAIAVRKESLAN
ncbi:MAG: glycerophosphodiester phosphodiesterase [Bryobacteraceae bacterium]